MGGTFTVMLTVSGALREPSLPVTTVAELIALAKAKPGQITFGTSSIGGPTHLLAELFNTVAGIYAPVTGRADITGRVAPLFDATLGMDPEATGHENILLRGLFLGMSRPQN